MDINELPPELQKQIKDYKREQEGKVKFTRNSVKLFHIFCDRYESLDSLEREINNWFKSQHDKIQVIDIKYQCATVGYDVYNEPVQEKWEYSALIYYKF